MKKKILLSIEEEAIQVIDEMAANQGMDRSAYIVYLAANAKAESDKRIILPKNMTSKDELAKYLNIGPLTKEYSLFQDRIYDAKVYDPNYVRKGSM